MPDTCVWTASCLGAPDARPRTEYDARMTDFMYFGGPVYCSTIKKVAWKRPTEILCKPLEGSSNRRFYDTLGPDPIGKLLQKANVTNPGSIGFAGFTAFHGFLSPILEKFSDRVDYVHLADACFQGAGATGAKIGFANFARRAIEGKARMTVTTNGPWDQDIHYSGPAGSKYEGTRFDLTSGAKCFHNVWREVTGDAPPADAEVPPGVVRPDRIFKKGELYWFHYDGKGVKDPHGWHVNELAAPYIQLYGVPWMAGEGRGGGLVGPVTLPGVSSPAGLAVAGLAALAALIAGGYWWWTSRQRYRPNYVPGTFPKVCNNCGRRYSLFGWETLPLLGSTEYPWGEVGEYRNCPCGSTLYVLLVEGEPE